MTITAGYELATDAQFRELSNFSTPPRAGRITAIEASGQVRVDTDDPDGGDVLAWPLNGFTYAVDDVVYVAFAVNNPDSAIVIGSISPLPLLDHAVLIPFDHGSELSGLGDDDHVQYLLLAGRSGGQVLVGLSTGEALRIYRNLTAAATDSPVLYVLQDNASDDQVALLVQQDGVAAALRLGTASGALLDFVGGFSITEGANVFNTGFFRGGSNDAIALTVVRSAAGNTMMGTGVDGDTQRRLVIQADGTFVWGDGSATRETNLYRNAANELKTDDAFLIALQLRVGLDSIGATNAGVKAGTSSNDAGLGGVLYEFRTQTGNVGAGEDDLASYSVPANTLSANGMALRFEAWGSFANNANTKRLRARFGTAGTNQVFDSTAVAIANQVWRMEGRIVRTGAATQKSMTEVAIGPNGGGTAATPYLEMATGLNQTLSGAVTFKITGEGVANNDIVIEGFVVEWMDANT